jgi:Protein of unknown function (DUF2934)
MFCDTPKILMTANGRSYSMPKDTSKKSHAMVLSEQPELERQTRERAYELYEARGREDGHDLEDWLRAEEEIMNKMEKKVRPIAA